MGKPKKLTSFLSLKRQTKKFEGVNRFQSNMERSSSSYDTKEKKAVAKAPLAPFSESRKPQELQIDMDRLRKLLIGLGHSEQEVIAAQNELKREKQMQWQS